MPETRTLMAKAVLVGEKAVGKTSLIRRYVLDQYDDRYLTTLGAKVSKKVVDIPVPEKDLVASLDMNIWDIMGQAGFRELAKEAYFHGARGILAVVDLTRKPTLDAAGDWVRTVREVAGPVPMVLLGNKKDLVAEAAVGQQELAAAARGFGCSFFLTSAKTGENVEVAFRRLANLVVRAYFQV